MANPSFQTLYKEFLEDVRKHRVGTVLPEVFTLIFNQAVEEVVTNKLATFEINKKISIDLLPLKKEVRLGTLSVSNNEGVYELEDDFRREIRIALILNGKSIKCIMLSGNQKTSMLNGVYSKPSLFKAYYSLRNEAKDKIVIYLPKNIIIEAAKIDIEYYCNPIPVDVSKIVSSSEYCQFNREVSTEIVNTACRMYLERVQDPRYQTNMNELNQKNNKT